MYIQLHACIARKKKCNDGLLNSIPINQQQINHLKRLTKYRLQFVYICRWFCETSTSYNNKLHFIFFYLYLTFLYRRHHSIKKYRVVFWGFFGFFFNTFLSFSTDVNLKTISITRRVTVSTYSVKTLDIDDTIYLGH